MPNLIADRVAFFLKDFPPFNFLQYEELQDLSLHISVGYYKASQLIFGEKEANKGHCFVLRKGSVKLFQQKENSSVLLDICEPGDVFGVRSILSGKAYVMSAIAQEESLVYAIPVDVFRDLLEKHQKVSMYFASGYAAGQAIVRGGQQGAGLSVNSAVDNHLEYAKRVVSCGIDESVKIATQKMTDENVGSIIVLDARGLAAGILTDSDLRRKVVSKNLDVNLPVSEVMSSPVMTVAPDISTAEVEMKMIQSGIHHLLVTKDGTPDAQVLGMISEHDILMSRLNHPSALLKAIRQSDDVEYWAEVRDKAENLLKTYLTQEISVTLIASLIGQINDMIIQKAIKQSIEKRGLEGVKFCWLSLGSEGREEQLLRTDQDNAIVFADSDDNEKIQQLLLEVAADVNGILKKCGFEECPADIMARNPKWCQPISAWQQYFTDWIITPDPQSVMNSTIFFDFRPVYGDSEIADNLREHLLTEIKRKDIFLNFLAKNATLNPPPLSFFNNLLVERSGEHANEFDIKKRAMMPLADSARLLMLHHGLGDTSNTMQRFRKLIGYEPNHASLMEEAAQAYEILMRFRTRSGLAHGDSGRFVEVSRLNKLEKQILKNAFQPIKELQEILEVRFKLSYFN